MSMSNCPKNSIFYYTNNILPPKLLNYTLNEALKHSQENDCELILTSHFPLTKKYEVVKLGEEHYYEDMSPITREKKKSSLYDYIISGNIIEDDRVKAYVVGKLPYSLDSIIRQLLLSMEVCNGENIILMEHDCLYPKNYIESINKAVNGYNKDLTYCHYANVFLSSNGYCNQSNPTLFLGNCAGKKDLFKELYTKKLELFLSGKSRLFEPLLIILIIKRKY